MNWKEIYQKLCNFLYNSILYYKFKVFIAKLNNLVMGKKTKKEQDSLDKDKDTLAREKVELLLADVPTVSSKEVNDFTEDVVDDAIVTKQKKKSTDWLEEQISSLTEKNEQLESQLADAKESFKKLSADFVSARKKGGVSESDSELKQKIVTLFKKFEDQYLGNNPTKERFTHVKLVNPPNNTGILDEFIKAFGDLLRKK